MAAMGSSCPTSSWWNTTHIPRSRWKWLSLLPKKPVRFIWTLVLTLVILTVTSWLIHPIRISCPGNNDKMSLMPGESQILTENTEPGHLRCTRDCNNETSVHTKVPYRTPSEIRYWQGVDYLKMCLTVNSTQPTEPTKGETIMLDTET